MKTMIALAAALVLAPQDHAPDKDGFIRNWLVLAPIAIAEDSGASELDVEQIAGEASLKPKEGEKSKANGKEMPWKAHKTADTFIDFRESFGADRAEDVAGYAATYVHAPEEMKVTLAVGSNDQCKVWLNGKQVIKFDQTRTLEADADKADVTLAKGCNVLVMKVVNEKNNWQGCARFLKDGKGVAGLKIGLAPQ
jgi:hypothetical protein